MIHFWAKTTSEGRPGISVYDHMVDVGNVAQCLAEMAPEILGRFHFQPSVIGALAALHDIGKISPGFQQKCQAWLEERGLLEVSQNGCWDTAMEPNHGKVSHASIQTFLIEIGAGHNMAKYVSTILGGHHGRLSPPSDRGYRPRGAMSEATSTIDWEAARAETARMICDHFAVPEMSCELDDSSPALWWLAGLTSVADWIGSDEQFFSPEKRSEGEHDTSLARKALDAIGFTPPVFKKDLSFETIFGFSPNEMQTKAMAAITGPGVYVIEAPMGMGKTEAALAAAYQLMMSGKARGIYFALPTQVTSNRIHVRVNEFLNQITRNVPIARLIHRNSWLTDNQMGICPTATQRKGDILDDARIGRDWFTSTKRSLIASFGVGTVDQALLGVVAAKHFFVRHFALAGKVVIIDEVHSYDEYTGRLVDNLIETLQGLGCTVIVLSATLTGKRRRQIVACGETPVVDDAEEPYPLITGQIDGEPLETVTMVPPSSRTIKVDFLLKEDAANEASTLARDGGAVLWICNTVAAAQEQYQRFIEIGQGEILVGLVHSRFPFWRRDELETEWMERFGKEGASRCGSILVSTQVVEQSVDLDADLMITELAPTDMLLQRLGRLWRHVRHNRPVDAPRVCIVEEKAGLDELRRMGPKAIKAALGEKAKVYAPYVLLRSLEIWKSQKRGVNIPSQIRELIESTYEDREQEPNSWRELYYDWFGTDSAKRMLACRNSNLWQLALEDREGVQTRINETPTVSIVLCRRAGETEATFIDGSRGKLRKNVFHFPTAQAIHRNIVKLPEHCLDHVDSNTMFSEYVYEKHGLGTVMSDGSVEVAGLKEGTKLFYSDSLGLVINKVS